MRTTGGAQRQALIWKGVLRHDGGRTEVKVRNLSTTGAMIQSAAPVAVGSEALLELSEGVAIAATVKWVLSDHAGLGFHTPFDLDLLASSKQPAATQPSWAPPRFLDSAIQEAWDRRIRRLSTAQLRAEFKGYLSD